MKVTMKAWNKSRAGNVILLVLLILFFGCVSIVIFSDLLSGDERLSLWMYVFCPEITAVFAWALYITLSSNHLYCMDAVKGEMT